MTLEDFYNGAYNKIRAFAYTPIGLASTINEASHFFDGKEGNEDMLGLAIGAYLLIRGVTGAVNMYRQRSELEKKIDG